MLHKKLLRSSLEGIRSKSVDKDVTVKGSYGIVYIVEVACICITLFKNPLCSYIAIAYIIMYVGKVVTDK